MKNLRLVSFVGVDEKTDLDELEKFSNSFGGFGLVEWSVLFSDTKSLTKDNRYPSYNFCKDFLDHSMNKTHYVHSSLHLCGDVINRYLNKEQDVLDLCKNAARIQLNLNIHNYPNHTELSEKIWSMQKNYGHSIILQQNKIKEKFMKVFLENNIFPISLLYDGSGGFGREITDIVSPSQEYYTGYAGGIKPENAKKIVELIESVNPDNIVYYIDMESGVREDNVFSLDKCWRVMEELDFVRP